ncbi:MAG: hypothetical protein DI529_01120 [Chryseobacterium sp.]|nr:MAG: hypothetical protein DI529_01120 [Chryseobacterium sp.]
MNNSKKQQLNQRNSTKASANNSSQVTHSHSIFTKEDANFVKRVREITAKSSSLAGIINSSRLKKQIQFESSLERDFIYLLEYDTMVKNYLEQPLEISYFDLRGKKRKYIPDFIIEYYGNKSSKLIEIKYESTLKSKKEELQLKFDAAKLFCDKHNFEFRIITESYIRDEKGIELLNYKFLERYKNFFENINKEKSAFPAFNNDVAILMKAMKNNTPCRVQYLIDQITNNKDKQAELIFLTWFMVSNKFFMTNLSEKLTLNSMIWLP